MGYFSNGTEGELYQEKYCNRCMHDKNKNCPIWLAHLLYNYELCNSKNNPLNILIPLSKDGLTNEQCTMFSPIKIKWKK